MKENYGGLMGTPSTLCGNDMKYWITTWVYLRELNLSLNPHC